MTFARRSLALGSLASERSFAQEKDAHALVDAIFADWKHRQTALKSARYVLTGTIEFIDKQLPPGNPKQPYHGVLLLDLSQKRYRLDETEWVQSLQCARITAFLLAA